MNSKVQSAVEALRKVDSLEALRELAETLSCRAESPGGFVYNQGWEDKVSARKRALYLAAKGEQKNIIDQTDRAQFLHQKDAAGENLVEQTAFRIFAQNGASPSEALTGAIDFIWGGGKTSEADSLWGQALSEWCRSLSGDIHRIFLPMQAKRSP
jgi:hypothetical protein